MVLYLHPCRVAAIYNHHSAELHACRITIQSRKSRASAPEYLARRRFCQRGKSPPSILGIRRGSGELTLIQSSAAP